jgi:hypothetical protein
MRDKTESTLPENSEHSLPFFARFLEGQDKSKGPNQTLKYPSDQMSGISELRTRRRQPTEQ